MTQEEKAKAYDKVLEKANALYKAAEPMSGCNVILETLFPELAESDDEKIRKELITHCRNTRCVTEEGAEKIAKWIAWLEKQVEQEEPQVYKTDDGEVITYSETEGYNVIEPKFKVGDWILYSGDNYEGVRHITKINENGYYIEINGLPHGIIPFNHEICMRLWTIQDAKDGDILTVERDKTPFIFKGFDKFHPECPVAYCGIDDSGIFINSDDGWWTDEKVNPATKEQRDTLFAKMKEAGYEWNADKKELKKIEQQFVNNEYTFKSIPRLLEMIEHTDRAKAYCQKLIDSLQKEGYSIDAKIVGDCLKQMNGEKVAMAVMDNVMDKQKPAWSEDDEKTLNEIFSVAARASLRKSTLFGKSYDYIKWQNWLKSLKYRITWKPSDEQIDAFEQFVRSMGESGYASPYDNNTKLLYSLLGQLKKLI